MVAGSRWGLLYERLKKRCGAKKAIVAVARRAWCVIVSPHLAQLV